MLLLLALKNLLRNHRRTFTILITVAMGSGSIFIFHGFNVGIMSHYRENTIHSRFGHGQVNKLGYRDQVYEKPWEHWITNWPELRQKLLNTPGVQYLFPRVEFFALLTNGKITVAGRGQGIDGAQESNFFHTLNIEDGVTLSNQPDGILLGKGLAKALDVRPGDRITVLANTIHGSMSGIDTIVTGVFHTGSKDFDDVAFRVPLTQAHLLLDTDKMESVAIGLHSLKDWKNLSEVIQKDFPNLEATPFAVLDKVYYQHAVDWLNSQFGVIRVIILFVVILGIFNTISSGILERKQEVGNLRANGESSSEVLCLLTLEGLALGIFGSGLGLLIAWFLTITVLGNGILMPPAPGITRQFHILIELQVSMAFTAFILGSLTAVVGSILAGLKVVKMPIGEALRSV